MKGETPVRAATLEDLPAVLLVAGQTPSVPQWNETVWRSMLAPHPDSAPLKRILLVHEADGAMIGFAAASVLRAVAEAELESLAVLPSCRRQGVATGLLAAVVRWVQEQGAECIRLEVRAGNHAALQLYLTNGFAACGRRAGYYTAPVEDAILLERPTGPVHR